MLPRQRLISLFALIIFLIIISISNVINVKAAVNENGQLQINSEVLQQKKESHQNHGNSSKAAKDIPDLFDPKYSKGLNKDKLKQSEGIRKSQKNVFAKKKPQVDLDAKSNKKIGKKLFIKKKISTNAGSNPSEGNSGINIKKGLGIIFLLISCISIGLFLGIKGQKLIFRRSKNG